ncbi:Putative methyl-accepting chemotaxis sensory transducer [Legionella pneumophila subsp. pneumophila]|uniref:methyl-accepting chemotaxis protein n=1 Tax=Legionella pneumophila TaxID=446 RepID=UPI00026D962C|nr:methyl-accepting chemotaxis protein [Legionella pneumophila]CCD08910.1 Putative methyl-accepting chemotaxis sensory transducer [Legionella pneumophila subsp. pneumophila]
MKTNANQRRFVITLRTRLFVGFMTLGLPLLILIMFLVPKVNYITHLSHKIQSENLPPILDSQIYQAQDILEHWAMTGDPKDKIYFANIWHEIDRVRGQWDQVIRVLDNQEIRHKWNKLHQLYGSLHQVQASIINALRDPNNLDNVENTRNKTRTFQKSMIDLIDGPYSETTGKREGGLFSDLSKEIESHINEIDKNLLSLKESALWLLILAIVLTVIVPYMTQRAISIPLDNAIHVAERIAAGERNVTIAIISADKLGKLLLSLKIMQDAIKKNEEMLRNKEEETRVLLETLINSSKKFSLHSSKVASGDLRDRLEIEDEGILQDLGRDLNSMTDRLSSITKKITQISSDIVTMVGTVLTSANKQAKEINSQASAINQISASLEEIDKSSKQTMAKAQVLREVAQNTYEQGKRGAHSVEQSILGIRASEEKMKLIAQTILDLSNHMQQIGEITLVVNTLAQQSKMLALNASIEASKAGESGKGFAAVATEVRNLAEQSEQSTVQVQKILEDIRRSTEKAVIVTEEGANTLDSGIKLIEKAGDVIHALSKMINEASISSQHIEASVRQEAIGIEQIVESMNEINRTTSTFSSGIKEMMTFIYNLDDIVKHLKKDISIYKV